MVLVEKGANKSVFFVNQHTVGGTRDGTPTHMTRVMRLNTEAEEFETIPGLTVGPALIDYHSFGNYKFDFSGIFGALLQMDVNVELKSYGLVSTATYFRTCFV